ncbi:MAG: ankyrin repeat domain-containing protein [Sphingomicrobium sp.]
MRRGMIGMAALGIGMAAVPVAGQIVGNDGLEFLKALKEDAGSKAYAIADRNGTNILNQRGTDGDAPLHIVVRKRNGNWIGFLLSKGADPNVAGSDGDTPLILAVRAGYMEGVTRLIGSQADVNRVNKRGESPLIVAVNQRQPQIAKLLLERGADPDKRDYAAGYSAREYAKRDNRMPELLRLIETVKRPTAKVAGPNR